MQATSARACLSAALLLAVASCSHVPDTSVLQVEPLPTNPTIHLTSATDAPLVLYVSNQSFEDDPVRIAAAVDGVPLVDGVFYVEGQHNWLTAYLELPPGEHTLVATSDTGATLTETFVLPADEQRWAILDYWYYPNESPRHLTWQIHDRPVAFG